MSLIYPLSLNAWYTGIATVAHNARNREQAQLPYTIDWACKLWPAVGNTLMNCWETISRRNTNACSVSCEGTMRGKGGPITAAVDVPGGPILAGDHGRRDTSTSRDVCAQAFPDFSMFPPTHNRCVM